MQGIYKITNIINNKVYIGESLNIEKRWEGHITELNSNTHHSYKLQKDWNTYGKDNFKFEVVECLDYIKYPIIRCILFIYEDNYIKQYNSVEQGYNCEYTLDKILKGEKKTDGVGLINIAMLQAYIDNIKSNGRYLRSEEKIKIVDAIRELRSSGKYILDKNLRSELTINKILFKNGLLNVSKIGTRTIKMIYTPKQELIDKGYFFVYIPLGVQDLNSKKTTYVTESGKKYLEEYLLENGLIKLNDKQLKTFKKFL